MKLKKYILINRVTSIFLFGFLFYCVLSQAQTNGLNPLKEDFRQEKMQWFKDAKLGIFIHWGIYAVNGVAESWSFYNGDVSYEDYMKQFNGFTAEKYQPKEWVKYIKESGAKYTVITSKHHDGVALWDTEHSDLSMPKKASVRLDVLTPFVKAVREDGYLKLGLYYSLLDWSHPDYPNFLRNKKRYKENPKRWSKFMSFNLSQLKEVQSFNPDLYWFDGDWEQSAEKWQAPKVRKMILDHNPKAIINSRLRGYGDYATPEQGVPIVKPEADFWELCMTMNKSWGYRHKDHDYKTVNQIIRMLVDCISMGGNLLLDIGPKADGSIPKEQIDILKGLGRWTKKHKNAIYGTISGIDKVHFNGYTSLSKDKTILYLYVDNNPNESLLIKGLNNKVKRAWVVGNGTNLKHKVVGKLSWRKEPGLLYIYLPEPLQDKDVTVVALKFDEPISLYKSEIKAIESN